MSRRGRLGVILVSVMLVFAVAAWTFVQGRNDPAAESFSGVFYVSDTPFPCGPTLEDMCTTLEVAPPSGQTGLIWSPDWNGIAGANGVGIGTGWQNTLDILASTKGNPVLSAAAYADAYVFDGKDDWYLPSKDELNELCKKFSNDRSDVAPEISKCRGSRAPMNGFSTANYWSSTQDANNNAWSQHFTSGDQYAYYKLNAGYVRPVRAFR